MSDVTGNLGGESIRLRGMALEDTQFKVLQEIEELVKLTEAMTRKTLGKDEYEKLKNKGLKLFDANVEEAGKSAKQSGKALSSLTGILNGAFAKAFEVLGGAINANLRTIRNFDGNIDDASYSIRAMSQNFRGSAAHVAKFAADSVSQLQEQYQQFKRMSDISGVVSSDFESLREMATNMNMTMDQYAGIMQENFINLRAGGNLVFKSMRGLSAAVSEIEKDSELGYIFNRLGIDATQYGKIILQQTALSRGLSNNMKEYGSNFSEAIRKSVISSIQLADAFGVQRSQMLDVQRKAQEDVFYDMMYQQLSGVDAPVKDALLKLFTGITGGDVEKAKKLTITALTGVTTDTYREVMSAGGDRLIEAAIQGASEVAKDANAMPKVMQRIGEEFQRHTERYGGNINDLSRFLSGLDVPLKSTFMMLFNGGRMFSKEGTEAAENAIERGKNAAKGQKTELDVLRDVQAQHILMAREAAKANTAINSFGLTLAHTTQLVTGIMNSVVSGTISTFGQDPAVKDALSKYNTVITDLSRQSQEYVSNATRAVMQDIIEGTKQGANQALTGGSNTGPVPTIQGTPLATEVKVKTGLNGRVETMRAADIDSKVGQHNRGGPSSLAIKQLIGVLAGAGDITVAGIDDAYAGRGTNSAHNKGRAVDFTIPGGSAEYKKKYDEIYQMLVGVYGLSPGRDFTLLDEKNFPSNHATGPHMHLEFTEGGAQKFQSKFKGFFQTSPVSSAPSGSNTSSTSAAGNGGSVALNGSAGDSGATGATALASSSNSGGITLGNNVNTRTSMVAIADETLLSKFDTLISKTDNMQNSFDSLARKLEGSTYSLG